MKTLKRTLCLVLALALSFSVVAGAASYSDYADAEAVAASEYAEAADVVIGLGIIKGVDGNKVDLDGTLTRAMAAKILCYMTLGETTAEALAAGTTQFSDVPASHWASKYIAYAASQGWLVGSEGKFSPDVEVTGYALGKMVLNAMGKGLSETTVNGTDVVVNAYEGAYWATNVSVDANDIGLFAGLKGVDLTKALTRGQAMEMVFTALEIQDKDQNDNTIDYKLKALAYAISKNTTGTADVCGRDGYKWVVDGDATKVLSGVYNVSADYTFTATAAPAGNAESDVLNAINAYYELEDDAKFTDGFTKITINGKEDSVASEHNIKVGDVVELYMDATDAKEIDKIVVIRYDLVKVVDVDTKVTEAADKKAGVTAYIDLSNTFNATKSNENVKDTEFVGFDYAKDDYVLVAVGKATGKTNTVIDSKAATIVSGKVTSTKGVTSCINGTYYETQAGAALTIGEEYTYAVNELGKLEAVISAPAASSTNVAYIYAIQKNVADGTYVDGTFVDGATSYVAYTVLADGTKAAYTLATEDKSLNTSDDTPTVTKSTVVKGDDTIILAGSETGKIAISFDGNGLKATEYAKTYAINADGKLEIVAKADTLTIGDKKDVTAIDKDTVKTDGKYLTNDTLFIFVSTDAETSAKVVKTVVGYKNVDIDAAADGEDMLVISNAKSEATVIYVFEEQAAATVEGTLAVLLDATPVITKEGNDSYYTYSVAVDGVATTITSKGAVAAIADTTIAAGSAFTYTTTDGAITAVLSVAYDDISDVVTYVGSDYIAVGETRYSTDGVTVYTVTKDTTGTDPVYTAVKGGTFYITDATADTTASNIKALNLDGVEGYEIIFIALVKAA